MSFNIPTDQIGEIDRAVIRKLLIENNPKNVVEVGCWTGGVSHLIMTLTDAKLTVIDTFQGEGSYLETFISTSNFNPLKAFTDNLEIYLPRIKILSGSVEFFKDDLETYDFIFIDGDHRYSRIKKDIDILFDKLSPGGIMAGHDFDGNNWNEKHLEEDYVHGLHHGVSKAVSEKFRDFNVEGRVWWLRKTSEAGAESPLGSPTTNVKPEMAPDGH